MNRPPRLEQDDPPEGADNEAALKDKARMKRPPEKAPPPDMLFGYDTEREQDLVDHEHGVIVINPLWIGD